MNLYDSILASKPLTAFKLNVAETAYVDITNRAVALTPSTTIAFTNSIIASDQSKSINAKEANRLSFLGDVVYAKGNERKSWSVEAWFSPINPTSGQVSIISHLGLYDGLSADQDFIHFKIDFATLTDIDLKWPMPDAYEAWHLVGTYTPGKVTLSVNGEKVAEADVSEAQIKDGFASASSTLYVGQSTGNIQGVVDGIATYTRALNDAEIYRHFTFGRRVRNTKDIVGTFGGNSFDGTNRDVFYTKEWSGRGWIDGTYTDVEFESGELSPAEDPATLLSRAGTWTGHYEVAAGPSFVYGVQVDWDGSGTYIVQTSINDGSSWQTAVNGRPLAGTWNWATAGKTVLVKITFTGGTTGDTSGVSRLRVVSFSNQYIYGTDMSRRLETFNGEIATSRDSNEPIENNVHAGIETYGAGSYKINPDTDPDTKPVRSLEFWVKFTAPPTNGYLFDSRPAGGTQYTWVATGQWAYVTGALYVNGVATPTATSTVQQDVWYHVIYVFSANVATQIDIPPTGSKQIAVLNTYPTALTAQNATDIYKSYVGYPKAALATESNPITEPATPYKLYAYDWAISAAG